MLIYTFELGLSKNKYQKMIPPWPWKVMTELINVSSKAEIKADR
jgi:hypothetical protein